ncbi:MAG: polyribonucleotide nucleotidyltransferase [Candidatus Hydrothermota bacterium]|nr:MAG: polyribonucleotide nucleotidyltransferase [Candidatus Hydrothermae bacterium]
MLRQVELELAGRVLTIETGRVARQADAHTLVRYGDTVVLVTVVSKRAKEPLDFLPLLVEYREQAYAAGKIPGGYIKREGKPRDREILYGRAIDRAIRPRFPKDMTDEVEVIAYLLSYDMENEGNVLGLIGASAALMLSDIPFNGPIGAVTVGRINGEYVLNPTNSQLNQSDFEMLIAGANGEVTMIEFGGKEVPEDVVLGAIEFAMPYIEQIEHLQEHLLSQMGEIEKREYTKIEVPEELDKAIRELAYDRIKEALSIPQKKVRTNTLKEIADDVKSQLAERFPDADVQMTRALYLLEREIMRKMVIEEGRRIDGRDFTEIRPVSAEVSLLPRTHGSALFTRGETQALVITTLGTAEDVQRLSELEPEEAKRFMLHYNFHPFSTGEIKPLRGPSRREIGHGALAEKAIEPLIPPEEEFPYTIRVVSDILESNGSSSMATVCGASLSLMDAGVPIKTAAAGVSIGLVMEDSKYQLLTDILGDEDHYGDMDFKVAGTKNGITAIQLDLKILGLPISMVAEVFKRAREARLHILDIMNRTIAEPRTELSKYAPKVLAIWIPKEKIGEVIGPGGRTIRKILDATDTKIEISEEGKVVIAGKDQESVEQAREMIEELVQDIQIGQVFMGKVTRTAPFGAFVEILPGKEGLVHISELDERRIKNVEDIVRPGDKILVKVIDIDEMGRVRLSRKAVLKGSVVKIVKKGGRFR